MRYVENKKRPGVYRSDSWMGIPLSISVLLAALLTGCSSGGGGSSDPSGGNPPPVVDAQAGNGNPQPGGSNDPDPPAAHPDPIPNPPPDPPENPPDDTDNTPPGGGSSGNGTDSNGGNPGSVPATPARVTLQPTQVRIAPNGRAQLTLLAYDAGGKVIFPTRTRPLTVRWVSNDSTVTAVDRLGWVTGVRAGTATVQAQLLVEGTALTAETVVSVDPQVAVHLLELNPARIQVGVSGSRSSKILAYNAQLQLITPACLNTAAVRVEPPYVSASLVIEADSARLDLIGIQTGTSWVTLECGGLVTAPLGVDVGIDEPLPKPAEFADWDGGFALDLDETLNGITLVSRDRAQQRPVRHARGHESNAHQWSTTVLPEFFSGPTPARMIADPASGESWLCGARDGQLGCQTQQTDGTWVHRAIAPAAPSSGPAGAVVFDGAVGANGIMWVGFASDANHFALARSEDEARQTWGITPLLTAKVNGVALTIAPDRQPRMLLHVDDGVYFGAPSGPGYWQFQRIDAASAPDLALAIGSDGRAQAVFRRGEQIVYAEQQGGGWHSSVLSAVPTGALTALGLRLDGNNLARVTVTDSHSMALRTVTRRFATSLNTNLAWRTEAPLANRQVGTDHVGLFDRHLRWSVGYRDAQSAQLMVYQEPLLPFYAAELDQNDIATAGVYSPVTTAPAGVQVQLSSRRVALNWEAVPDVLHYNVYWSQTPGVNFSSNQVPAVTVPQFEHAGRNNGETYYYAVSAVGAFGESALSVEIAATPQLDAPINLRVTADAGRNILTWDAVPGVTEYRIYWNTRGTPGAFDASFAVDGAATQFVHGGTTPNSTYYYAIQAADEYGTSPISSDIATLPAPRGLAADGIYQDGSLELSWDPVLGASSYTLYYSTTPGVSRDTAAHLSGVKPPFSHQELGHQVKYYYRIAASNIDGESALSEERSATSIINDTPFTWRRVSALPTTRHLLAAVTANGSVYAIGGSDGLATLDSFDVYNAALDQWESLGKLPRARREHGSVVVNGKLFVIGGWHDQATTDVVDIYDFTTRAWSIGAPMPIARSNFATAVAGSYIYVMGGWNGQELATVQRYDTTNNSWTELPPLPQARSHLVASVVGERIVVLGGRLLGQAVRTVNIFDVATAAWTAGADLPAARSQLAASVLNGRIYAIGGWDGLAPVNTVDVYDPRHDVWSTGTTMPTARNSLSSTVLNNKIYTLGGWNGSRHVSTVEVLGAQ